MKIRHLIALMMTLCLVSAAGAGEEHDHAAAAGEMDMEAMMAEWMKLAQPSEAHKDFEFFVGDWTYTSKSWMGGVESSSNGTASTKMLLGGRYLHSVTKGHYNGMDFEGIALSGYDNANGEHFNIWVDTMSTGMMLARGNKNDEGAMVLSGMTSDPMMGEMEFKYVSTVTGDDTYTFEMHMGPKGAMERVMEIQYTRVKS